MKAQLDFPPRNIVMRHRPLSRTIHILLVDDNQPVREFAALALGNAGYSVTTAQNGLEALDLLRANHYDLLVTDQEMPHLNGRDLIAKARAEGLKVPIVIISASLLFAGRSTEQLQLAGFLQKPFTTDELLAVVQQVTTAFSDPSLLQSRLSIDNAQSYRHWGINE